MPCPTDALKVTRFHPCLLNSPTAHVRRLHRVSLAGPALHEDFAQGASGSITGRVSDAATGKSLQGAIVKISGTNDVAYTNAEGRFTMSGIAAGSQRLNVEYVGLDPIAKSFMVVGGQSVSVDAALESAVLKLSAFTVAESVRGQALAINQQKTASGIVNIVSEETFSTNLGGNIGFTLQQLPGLSVDEGEDGEPSGVNIRGVEAKYTRASRR